MKSKTLGEEILAMNPLELCDWNVERVDELTSFVWDPLPDPCKPYAAPIENLLGEVKYLKTLIAEGKTQQAANCAIAVGMLFMAIQAKMAWPRTGGRPEGEGWQLLRDEYARDPSRKAGQVFDVVYTKYRKDHPNNSFPLSRDTATHHFKERVKDRYIPTQSHSVGKQSHPVARNGILPKDKPQ